MAVDTAGSASETTAAIPTFLTPIKQLPIHEEATSGIGYSTAAPVSGVAPASHAAESEAGLVSGVTPASQPATEEASASTAPSGSKSETLPDGTIDVGNPWAGMSSDIDPTS